MINNAAIFVLIGFAAIGFTACYLAFMFWLTDDEMIKERAEKKRLKRFCPRCKKDTSDVW